MEKRDVYISLLKDVDEISNINNIKYIVIDKTSLFIDVDKNIGLSPRQLNIAMTQGDAEKFREYLINNKEKYSNRFIESMLDNPKMNANLMRFGDNNTFELNVKELNFSRSNNFINNGVHINIRFIEKPTPQGLKKKRKITSKLWKIFNFRIEGNSLWLVKLCVVMANFFMNLITLGKFKFKHYYSNRKIFAIESWERIFDFEFVRIKNKIFPSDIFNIIKYVDTEDGIKLPILEKYETYLEIKYDSENTNVSKIKNLSKENTELVGVCFNQNDMESDPRYVETVSDIRKKREKLFKIRAKGLKYRNGIKRIKNVVKMTGDEISLKEYYLDLEEDIVRLFSNGQYKELENLFIPLKLSLFKYASKGMTYSISEDIDKIFDEVHIRLNYGNKINKIKELRKKEYYA